jgi:hypothetical protein
MRNNRNGKKNFIVSLIRRSQINKKILLTKNSDESLFEFTQKNLINIFENFFQENSDVC